MDYKYRIRCADQTLIDLHSPTYLTEHRGPRLHFTKIPRNRCQKPNPATETQYRVNSKLQASSAPRHQDSYLMLMAHDMRQYSWRSLAATRLAPIKDYLAQRGPQPLRLDPVPTEIRSKKQSWSQFASQRLARRSSGDSDAAVGVEKIVLLPGWASRRYRAELPVKPSDHAGVV